MGGILSSSTAQKPPGIKEIYRLSQKPHDIWWNRFVARPLACVMVALFLRLPVTPNQVTFFGAFIFLIVPAALIGLEGMTGIIIAALALQLAYLFDCADGQLARIQKMTSDVGGYLDFLIDEYKALVLVAGAGVRLYRFEESELWLLVALLGVLLVASATSLTNFVRRKEYSGVEVKPGASAKIPERPTGMLRTAIWLFRRFASWLVHYPSWFTYLIIVELFTNSTMVFLALFLGVYLLYTGVTSLAIFRKLAHPSFYKRHLS